MPHSHDNQPQRKKTGNWVDRGDPLEQTLSRVLGFALQREADDPQLVEHVLTIRGLVEADATEVHVSRYLRPLFITFCGEEPDREFRRTLGIALWHIAKAGLVRDRARRHADELRRQLPPEPRLAERLARSIIRAPD